MNFQLGTTLFFCQAEDQLRIVEEQRKIHEERMKLEQDRQKQQKEEQKIILGKGKSRPKLSFSLKATEWGSDSLQSHPALPLINPSPMSATRFILEVLNEGKEKVVQLSVETCNPVKVHILPPGKEEHRDLDGPDYSFASFSFFPSHT